MCSVQAAFVGLIAAVPEQMGASRWEYEDFEAFFHHWRCVGHCLGITDEFNLCSGTVEDTQALCRRIFFEEHSRLINPPLHEGRLMGDAVIVAFGSKPEAFRKYTAVNVLNCDPEAFPLSSWGEKFNYAMFELFFHKLAYYPIFHWLISRLVDIFLFLATRYRRVFAKYLAWKYPQKEYQFEPLRCCPFKTDINYKSFSDYWPNKWVVCCLKLFVVDKIIMKYSREVKGEEDESDDRQRLTPSRGFFWMEWGRKWDLEIS